MFYFCSILEVQISEIFSIQFLLSRQTLSFIFFPDSAIFLSHPFILVCIYHFLKVPPGTEQYSAVKFVLYIYKPISDTTRKVPGFFFFFPPYFKIPLNPFFSPLNFHTARKLNTKGCYYFNYVNEEFCG